MACMLVFACNDVFEDDITNDTIQIISPMSGAIIDGNRVQFSWNDLDGADDYRIQILDDQQVRILDSLVPTNVVSFVFNSGAYQWRVRGENFAYTSSYSFPTDFSLEASEDLTNQVVSLQTPASNFYTNEPDILFTWAGIETANTYSFELLKDDNGLQTILLEEGIIATSFSVDAVLLDTDAEYIWKVKALNDSSETPFEGRSFFLDTETPNQPTLVAPVDMETGATIVNFNWTNVTETGNVQSPVMNTIEIGDDIDFNTLVITDTTVNNSYQYTFDTSGTYYWRVKAEDAANNTSDYSMVRSVIVE